MCIASGERSCLSSLENVLLWAMRAWVIGIGKRVPVEEQIVNVFTRFASPDAAGQMNGFVTILAHGAFRMINIDCVCKTLVSDDEKTLIDVFALTQHGRSSEALILLRSLVTPNAAVAAVDCAQKLMASLTAAGWFLTPQPTNFNVMAEITGGGRETERRPVALH